MTTPQQHAELAAQLHHIANTRILSTEEIGALHTAANIFAAMPPIKCPITLTVNGREWVLPEPLKDAPEDDVVVWNTDVVGEPCSWVWRGTDTQLAALQAGNLYATADDTQAWADFDKWCRGGGDE